jgi:hypothetical protein
MNYELPQDIHDETECPNDFGCLTDGACKDFPVCDANFIGNRNITFLNPGVTKEVLNKCPYVFSSHGRLICKCPARHYLFDKYRV